MIGHALNPLFAKTGLVVFKKHQHSVFQCNTFQSKVEHRGLMLKKIRNQVQGPVLFIHHLFLIPALENKVGLKNRRMIFSGVNSQVLYHVGKRIVPMFKAVENGLTNLLQKIPEQVGGLEMSSDGNQVHEITHNPIKTGLRSSSDRGSNNQLFLMGVAVQ